ncbi:solute carrier family 25 member 45 [Calycina marina]|uniref:Solute carrier family 25 member 45 n=1 Tax=Calycina marina TaxID=1763456 RepID=A0A9P8CE99_9HELO|nr:solute carrier family 25 member 45 [Calycina marina]
MADFVASYVSGIAALFIGNPLDLLKVRLQAGTPDTAPVRPVVPANRVTSLLRGVAGPALICGAFNSLVFVSYNRSSDLISSLFEAKGKPSLYTAWTSGAIGGLAGLVLSTPVELVKCQAQLVPGTTSWGIAKRIARNEGLKGLYRGGVVTAWRDSIGYGFYFWSYELSSRYVQSKMKDDRGNTSEAMKVLLCGGVAGVVTWASIYPLDVIKTRVQMQTGNESTALLRSSDTVPASLQRKRLGATQLTRNAWKTEGAGVLFKGLRVCCVRAFMVNAVQWAVYEWLMDEFRVKKE